MKKEEKWLYWTPRVVSILFLLFLAMFSLDVITPEASFGEILLGLLMHNIPVFVLAILLWISWKHEIVGAITFFIAGIAYIIMVAMRQPWYLALSWGMTIAGPAFFVGIMFLLNWKRKRKR